MSTHFLGQLSHSFSHGICIGLQTTEKNTQKVFSSFLTLCFPSSLSKLCDLTYSKSPEARRQWEQEGIGKSGEGSISWDCPDSWEMNKTSSNFRGFNLKWLSHKKFMPGQELKTVASFSFQGMQCKCSHLIFKTNFGQVQSGGRHMEVGGSVRGGWVRAISWFMAIY